MIAHKPSIEVMVAEAERAAALARKYGWDGRESPVEFLALALEGRKRASMSVIYSSEREAE